MNTDLTATAQAIRKIIHKFIHERFIQKTDKLEPDSDKYHEEQEKHKVNNWLKNAANRSQSLQVVTHPLKASYPDAHIARTNSLFCPPDSLNDHGLVNTASLGEEFDSDVTGNAASLDIYRLLQQKFEGKSLLTLCLSYNEDMRAALHDDPEIAHNLITAFANVTKPKTDKTSSHAMAKQLYWLVVDEPYDDDNYVLLAPLYSSSLAHAVYTQIQADRFSDEAKASADARRNNKSHTGTVRIYPNLSIQKIGGSNPQNTSYLNSRRVGTNYLLASLPPTWHSSNLKPIFFDENAFNRFQWKRSTRLGWNANYWLDALQKFLLSDPPPVMQTRKRIARLINGLIDELHIFTQIHHELPSGWSADERCHLSTAQKCWLDPQRAVKDNEFAKKWVYSDWDAEVEADFARWVNHRLDKKIKFLGDIEFRHWAKELKTDNKWSFTITDQFRQISEVARGA